MITLVYARSKAPCRLYQKTYTSILRTTYYVDMDNSDKLTEQIKGIINETPSVTFPGFNDCTHHDFIGTLQAPVASFGGKSLIPGESTFWTDEVKTKGIVYDYSIPEKFSLWLVRFPTYYYGWWVTGNYNGLSMLRYENGFTDAASANAAIASLRNGVGWGNQALRSLGTQQCPSMDITNRVIALKQMLLLEPENLLYSWIIEYNLNQLVSTVLSNQQDIQTLGSMLEVASDGLIAGAVGGILKNCAAALKAGASSVSVGKLISTVQLHAKNYLAMQYGIKAPLRDYASLWDTVKRYYTDGMVPFWVRTDSAQLNGSYKDWTWNTRFGLKYDSRDTTVLADTLNLMYQAGFGLSFEKVWDIVPLSFAIDWVYNVSSILQSLDAKINSYRCPIIGSWSSLKATRPVSAEKLGFPGWSSNVTEKYYLRYARPTVPDVSIAYTARHTTGTISTSSIDEAAALAVVLA